MDRDCADSGAAPALQAGDRATVGYGRQGGGIEVGAIHEAGHTTRQTTLLVRGRAPVIDPAWESSDVGLEELVLAYMGQDAAPAISQLAPIGDGQ